MYPTLSKVSVGEPDANSEYFSALRAGRRPIFLDGFYSPPHFPFDEFKNGEKYLVYGQKGTGKTSILRHIQDTAQADASEFLIFKRAFLEEVDLADFSKIPLMLDEDEIKRFKHYHHTVKRLLILILIRKAFELNPAKVEDDELPDPESRSLVQRIADSPVGDAIKLGIDSIGHIFQAIGLNVEKLTGGALLLEGGKTIKRSNDSLLSFLIKRLRRDDKSISLYIDEIHFAYRSEDSLQ